MAVPVLTGYLEFALTRAEYKRMMQKRNRNLFDSPIGSKPRDTGKDSDG